MNIKAKIIRQESQHRGGSTREFGYCMVSITDKCELQTKWWGIKVKT